jgi:hypothetical protein
MSMAAGLKIKEAWPGQPGTARDIDNNAGRLQDFFQQFRKLSLAASITGGDFCVDCGGTHRSVVSRCRRRSFFAKPKTKVGMQYGKFLFFLSRRLDFSWSANDKEDEAIQLRFCSLAAAQAHCIQPTEE